MTLTELSIIPKVQLAGEYWYFDALRWKKQYNLEFLKGAEKDNKFISCLNEIKVWQQTAEDNKPSWLQHPITITVLVLAAFTTGLAIGL